LRCFIHNSFRRRRCTIKHNIRKDKIMGFERHSTHSGCSDFAMAAYPMPFFHLAQCRYLGSGWLASTKARSTSEYTPCRSLLRTTASISAICFRCSFVLCWASSIQRSNFASGTSADWRYTSMVCSSTKRRHASLPCNAFQIHCKYGDIVYGSICR